MPNPILNINGNVLIKTAVQWAADTTVYSGKTILITSDVTYTGTDQRKFKIADGTQTWANLDYFPADIIYLSGTTKTVQQSDVIAQWIGATNRFSLTNDNNAYAKAWIFMTQTSASYGFNDAWLEAATGYLYLKASNVNMFSEPDGSRILSLDASKNIKGLDTATYPDLTELSYVKGVTSAIQTQLNGKQAAGSYLTSANITQVITNGVTDKAPSEDAVFDALANKQPLDADLTAIAALTTTAYGRSLLELASLAALATNLSTVGVSRKMLAYANTSQSHTGNTNETIIEDGLLISANTLGANDRLQIEAQHGATGTAGTKIFRYYLNTSANTLVGASQIGTTTLTATQLSGSFERRIVNKNSVSTNNVYPSNNNSTTDLTANNSAFTALNWNFAVNTYLIVTVQLANSGDTGTLENIQIYCDKA